MVFNKNILTLIALSFFNLILAAPVAEGKKNVIIMVPDGFGPSGLNLARTYKQQKFGLDINERLHLDPQLIGTLRTRSNSSLITDSAASGSAYATGFKTFNGAISVGPNGAPRGTLMEALKAQGYKTGLVVKSTLTDATPAVFASHIEDRDYEDKIAEQLVGLGKLGHVVDYMSGGGKCWFIPQDQKGSCREDDVDLISQAKDMGYQYFETREQFDEYAKNGLSLPALSFWDNKEIPYDLDRDSSVTPSLAEQAKLALNTLEEASKDSDKGFIVMIEGSQIDECAHGSDAACLAQEAIEFDDAFKAVKDFIDQSATESVVVVAADHDTGGLGLGWNDLDTWKPEVLLNVKKTSFIFEKMITDKFEETQNNATLVPEIKNWIVNNLNINDATEEEVQKVLDAVWEDENIANKLSEIVNARAQISFSTYGHTSVDINCHFYTNSEEMSKVFNSVEVSKGLKGNHDNTELNDVLAAITNADLEAITKKLNE